MIGGVQDYVTRPLFQGESTFELIDRGAQYLKQAKDEAARLGVSTDDTEIYVTHFPCYNCCKALVQAGIKKINYYFDYRDNPLALKLLHDCGVPYEQIKIDRKYVEGLAHKLEEDEN